MKNALFSVALLFSVSSEAHSQGMVDVCLALAGSNLIDERNESSAISTFSSERDELCESESERSLRFKQMSASMRGSVYGFFSARASGGGSEREESERQRQFCEMSQSEFEGLVSSRFQSSTGSILADRVVDCVEVLANAKEARVIGTASVTPDDKGFNVRVAFIPGQMTQVYKLAAITGDYSCWADFKNQKPAVGNVELTGNSSGAFFCEKEAGESVDTDFTFVADIGAGGTSSTGVRATLKSVNAEAETAAEIERRVSEISQSFNLRLNELEKQLQLQNGIEVVEQGSYTGTEAVASFEVNLKEPGLLLVSGYGTAKRVGAAANAGVYTIIRVDGQYCAIDLSFEGETSSVTFYSASACNILLPAGKHSFEFERQDHPGATEVGTTTMNWQILKVRQPKP